FRKILFKIIIGFFSFKTNDPELQNSKKLGWLIILTIIPAGIIGLLFGDWIENNLRSSLVIGVGLIFWGLVLYIAERYQQRSLIADHRSLKTVGWKQALFIGCAQAIALIPGTSRSGITMTAGLFSKLDKKSAAEFSFLMSVPIIVLAGGLNLLELIQKGLGDLNLTVLFAGFVAAAMSGFIAITGLMKIIQKWSFKPFVIYRIVVGILILIFFI
ncbi:MAG: undecaprenyl-diphosphate phosphatase, partial [Candidatus Magasanikbacteria bacterium]|nr:undecaprenyl-diphosphate phosphatase [Candidatus Magasanikbacteria bacterium]